MTVSGPAGAAAGGATPWRVSGGETDFFISHAGRDTGWAEWLAWQLQQAGYRVELAVWDWAPGEDFVARMQTALEAADRLLAVCTEAYFASAFGGAELRAAFAGQAGAEGRIVPVLIEPVRLPLVTSAAVRPKSPSFEARCCAGCCTSRAFGRVGPLRSVLERVSNGAGRSSAHGRVGNPPIDPVDCLSAAPGSVMRRTVSGNARSEASRGGARSSLTSVTT